MSARAKRTTTTVIEGEEGDDTERPEEPLEEDVLRALVELDTANEIRWQIWRVSNPNPGFCFELSSAEVSVARISQDAGAGKYKVKGIKHTGEYFKSTTVVIATAPKTQTPTIIAPPAQDNTLLIAMMQQSQEFSRQQTAVLTAMIGKPAREIPWAAIVAASPLLLKEFKDFLKKDNADDASMERVLKLVTVVEKLRGNDKESPSSWTDIIRDALPSLASAFNRGAAPQPVSQASARVAFPVQLAPPSSREILGENIETPEAIEPTAEILMMNWLRDKLNELIANAAANKNPELRAEVFCDDLPIYVPEAMVIQMLNAENWFEQLQTFEPRVLAYPAWFAELRDCILETLSPDGEDEHGERHTRPAAPSAGPEAADA